MAPTVRIFFSSLIVSSTGDPIVASVCRLSGARMVPQVPTAMADPLRRKKLPSAKADFCRKGDR